MTDQETFQRFCDLLQGLVAKKHQETIIMDAPSCTQLIATIQLALRHPGNNGPTAQLMEQLTRNLIRRLDRAAPGLGAILEYGFNPEHDVQ